LLRTDRLVGDRPTGIVDDANLDVRSADVDADEVQSPDRRG
jgi:hypothetical protein